MVFAIFEYMFNKINTIAGLSESVRKNLTGLYPKGEIEQFVFLIFNHLLNYSKIDIHLNSHASVSDEIFEKVSSIIAQLKEFQPIQYIFGETEFYGLKFFLNPYVLIPRQETEELVQWVISENTAKNIRILDIGTGSGCIAVVLARNIENSVVNAFDISVKALETAIKNASMNGVKVNFYKYDILGDEVLPENVVYDIIVSNPPYVRESEKHLSGLNVTGFEPHEAIFVGDEDAFIFYKAIAAFGKKYLKKGGNIYMEINEALGTEIKALLLDSGYHDVVLKRDINNKDRMLKAKLI